MDRYRVLFVGVWSQSRALLVENHNNTHIIQIKGNKDDATQFMLCNQLNSTIFKQKWWLKHNDKPFNDNNKTSNATPRIMWTKYIYVKWKSKFGFYSTASHSLDRNRRKKYELVYFVRAFLCKYYHIVSIFKITLFRIHYPFK